MPVVVEHWSDPLCIWAYVGESRVDALRARHGAALDVRFRVVPVFGSVPARFTRGAWREGGPAARQAATQQVARQFGHFDVSGKVWVEDPPASSWAPSAAVMAVRLAEQAGTVPVGATGAYLRALRRRFFVEDLNVARLEIQAETAEQLGLPWERLGVALDDGTALAALWEDHEERLRLGIQGSPTWVFDGGRAMLYGNVGEGVLRATVDELVSGLGAGASRC